MGHVPVSLGMSCFSLYRAGDQNGMQWCMNTLKSIQGLIVVWPYFSATLQRDPWKKGIFNRRKKHGRFFIRHDPLDTLISPKIYARNFGKLFSCAKSDFTAAIRAEWPDVAILLPNFGYFWDLMAIFFPIFNIFWLCFTVRTIWGYFSAIFEKLYLVTLHTSLRII